MVARVTLAEIDAVRMSVGKAVELFEESVLPDLQEAPGYEGCYVLTTPEGKALVMSFWDSEESAEAGVQNGFYVAQVSKFVTFFHAPPGRQTYEVAIAEAPMVGASP
jgi:heme-degrading monooxygenase HmoA